MLAASEKSVKITNDMGNEKNLEHILLRGNNNLDLVRIVAALMVIIGHSYSLSLNQTHHEPLKLLFPFTHLGQVAVAIFFFISGILVTNSLATSGNIAAFSISRFFRIYPPFVFTILVTALVIGPIAYHGDISQYFSSPRLISYIKLNLQLDIQYFIDGVFVGNNDRGSVNGSIWTIPVEISAYLVVLSVYLFTGFNKRNIVSAICLFIIATPLSNIDGFNFIVNKKSAAYLLPSIFALGALYAINKEKIIVDWKAPLAFFILYKTSFSPYLSHFAFFACLCTATLYLSTFRITRAINIKHDISYGAYLWGFPIQQLLCYFYRLDTVGLIFYSVLSSILAGYISYFLIERPSMNFGKKVRSLL
ncbi:acyltransferase [Aeromonas caviae]|uniref:acyltransferase family protein n=1 Tax=Aeromonas caviae TaxID=648 RepID=UPI00301580F5